jgi:hypothetical protein
MKNIISILSIMLLASCVYTNRPQNNPDHRNRHQFIELHHSQTATPHNHFAYIEGRDVNGQWVTGHWREVPGSDPNARREGWHKIRGHWVGHGRDRHWVNPHWENSRDCHHR